MAAKPTELERAVRLVEEAISSVGVKPASVRLSMTGTQGPAWSLMRGSAAVAVFVRPPREREIGALLRVVAPVVDFEGDPSPELCRSLLDLNAGGLGGAWFGIQGQQVVVLAERPVEGLGLSEVRYILQCVGAVADHYDDVFARRHGLRRSSDPRP